MKKTKKPNKAIWAACILLCLVLLSTCLSSNIYAKFVSGASGADRARIARFHPTSDLNAGTTDGAYEISLRNSSEVAVYYTVTVQPYNPGQISSCSLNGVAGTAKDDGSFVFDRVDALKPGGSDTATLLLSADPSFDDPDVAPDLSFSSSSSVYDLDCPFTVTVSYEQIR